MNSCMSQLPKTLLFQQVHIRLGVNKVAVFYQHRNATGQASHGVIAHIAPVIALHLGKRIKQGIPDLF